MAALVRRDTTAPSTANATGYASASFTPVAGELLVVISAASATAADPAACTASANGMTFSQAVQIDNPSISAGVGLWLFVSNQVVPASPVAMTVTVTYTGDAATGSHIVVLGASGMSKVGTAAVRQTTLGSGANHTAGATPAVIFPANCLTTNPVIGMAINLTGTTSTVTPPGGFTERYDNFYSTPVTGCEVATRDSGHTANSLTWGSTMTGGLAVGVELDASAAATDYPRSVGESAPATDATAALGTRARGISETAAATDSTSANYVPGAGAYNRSVGESAPAVDGVARVRSSARALSESAPAADTVARSAPRARSITESAPASDGLARLAGISRSVPESAPASDAVARGSGGGGGGGGGAPPPPPAHGGAPPERPRHGLAAWESLRQPPTPRPVLRPAHGLSASPLPPRTP
jgi:hypothetical protein